MNDIVWVIPPSTLAWLDRVPTDRPVAMLIRHSVRGHLPPGEAGYELPITEVGHHLARLLGEHLRGRLRAVHASPLLRTMQTADRLAEGADAALTPIPDRLLGDPGVFVVSPAAGDTWKALGHEEVMRHLVCEAEPLPGLADADAAARCLVHHMLSRTDGQPGVHAFCTHDSLVTATAGRLLGVPLTKHDWPWYLEAAFFWRDAEGLHAAYRTWHGVRSSPLVGLTEQDVIGLARREVAATLGLDCPARFFLAGGMYKTLLTGRPPRDLDVWAATAADREALLAHLATRGAKPLPERPYSDAFEVAGRVVDVPRHTEPSELEARLLRFDLGLSAIGVEHRPGDLWRGFVHPLALASVARREVLLLPELLNWEHSLVSIERMRRYSAELGYRAPASEEARIWEIFDRQSPEMKAGMIERFERVARHDQGVAEEVAGRFP